MKFPNGDVYDGCFVNGSIQGQGMMRYQDGSTYVGQWWSDKRHGRGLFTWPGGAASYDGEWFKGDQQGEGILRYEDGSKYYGAFKSNVKDGRGIFKYPDGSSYHGEWRDDLKHGQGSFVWANNQRFTGSFDRGEMKSGTLVGPDGSSKDVQF